MVSLDVAGFTRLVQEDERATLAELAVIRRDLIEGTLQKRSGHLFKTMGDGALIEFLNVEDAVKWTLEFQEAMAARNRSRGDKPILVRAGIALADVYVEGEDRYGAAIAYLVRLQEVAPPGGIAMTHSVRWQLGKALVARFTRIMKTLKGMDEPWEVWVWPSAEAPSEDATVPPSRRIDDRDKSPLSIPDKPSLAVLPFQNMSGDPEQEYFAEGVVEEIITALSRVQSLFVIARNSSFTYKGRAVNVQQVGRELGVRYVIEGSVRRAGNRLRITGQLIDTSTGMHLWADRFEGKLEDVFDLRDQVTASVIGAIAPKLEQAEIERAKRKPTESLDAYDYFLRGISAIRQWTKEANHEALRMFNKAIELDPNFGSAYGMAARCYSQRKGGGWVTLSAQDIAEVRRLARRASELGRDDAVALSAAGIGLAYVVGEMDHGADLIDRAIALNPNLATAWLFGGWVRLWRGEPDAAIEQVARATRLSPNDPQLSMMHVVTACAHFFAGRNSQALLFAEKSMRLQPSYFMAASVLAASNAIAGRPAEAEKAMASLREIAPTLRVSNLLDAFPIRRQEDIVRWAEALRRAGLPE
jgi:TolB-like protein